MHERFGYFHPRNFLFFQRSDDAPSVFGPAKTRLGEDFSTARANWTGLRNRRRKLLSCSLQHCAVCYYCNCYLSCKCIRSERVPAHLQYFASLPSQLITTIFLFVLKQKKNGTFGTIFVPTVFFFFNFLYRYTPVHGISEIAMCTRKWF